MTISENIHKIVEQLKTAIKQHLDISEILEIEKENSNIYYELEKTCLIIEERLSKNDIKENYLKQLQQNFNNLLNQFPYKGQTDLSTFRVIQNRQHYKPQLENSFNQLKVKLDQLNFNFDFFNKLNFFSNNIVAIGANGSGKTSLANHLKGYLQNNGIIVSAQRVLNIPQFNSIQNPTKH